MPPTTPHVDMDPTVRSKLDQVIRHERKTRHKAVYERLHRQKVAGLLQKQIAQLRPQQLITLLTGDDDTIPWTELVDCIDTLLREQLLDGVIAKRASAVLNIVSCANTEEVDPKDRIGDLFWDKKKWMHELISGLQGQLSYIMSTTAVVGGDSGSEDADSKDRDSRLSAMENTSASVMNLCLMSGTVGRMALEQMVPLCNIIAIVSELLTAHHQLETVDRKSNKKRKKKREQTQLEEIMSNLLLALSGVALCQEGAAVLQENGMRMLEAVISYFAAKMEKSVVLESACACLWNVCFASPMACEQLALQPSHAELIRTIVSLSGNRSPFGTTVRRHAIHLLQHLAKFDITLLKETIPGLDSIPRLLRELAQGKEIALRTFAAETLWRMAQTHGDSNYTSDEFIKTLLEENAMDVLVHALMETIPRSADHHSTLQAITAVLASLSMSENTILLALFNEKNIIHTMLDLLSDKSLQNHRVISNSLAILSNLAASSLIARRTISSKRNIVNTDDLMNLVANENGTRTHLPHLHTIITLLASDENSIDVRSKAASLIINLTLDEQSCKDVVFFLQRIIDCLKDPSNDVVLQIKVATALWNMTSDSRVMAHLEKCSVLRTMVKLLPGTKLPQPKLSRDDLVLSDSDREETEGGDDDDDDRTDSSTYSTDDGCNKTNRHLHADLPMAHERHSTSYEQHNDEGKEKTQNHQLLKRRSLAEILQRRRSTSSSSLSKLPDFQSTANRREHSDVLADTFARKYATPDGASTTDFGLPKDSNTHVNPVVADDDDPNADKGIAEDQSQTQEQVAVSNQDDSVKEEAACLIQCCFRGYQVRKRFQSALATLRKDSEIVHSDMDGDGDTVIVDSSAVDSPMTENDEQERSTSKELDLPEEVKQVAKTSDEAEPIIEPITSNSHVENTSPSHTTEVALECESKQGISNVDREPGLPDTVEIRELSQEVPLVIDTPKKLSRSYSRSTIGRFGGDFLIALDNELPLKFDDPLVNVLKRINVKREYKDLKRLSIKEMNTLQLEDEINILKSELRNFEQDFKRTKGYPPTRQDKNALREIYERYKIAKGLLEVRKQRTAPREDNTTGKQELIDTNMEASDVSNQIANHQHSSQSESQAVANDSIKNSISSKMLHKRSLTILKMRSFKNKRSRIIREFFDEEVLYVDLLHITSAVLEKAKRFAKHMDGITLDIIDDFECIRLITLDFFTELYDEYSKADRMDKLEHLVIGQIFVKRLPTLRLYKTYARNFQESMEELKKAADLVSYCNVGIQEAIKASQYEHGAVTLRSALEKPLTHIMNYTRHMKRLQECTPRESDDVQYCTEALRQLTFISDYCDRLDVVRKLSSSQLPASTGIEQEQQLRQQRERRMSADRTEQTMMISVSKKYYLLVNYGFPAIQNSEFEQWIFEYHGKNMEKKLKEWRKLLPREFVDIATLAGSHLLLEESVLQKMRQLIKKHLPASLRPRVWFVLSGASRKASEGEGLYQKILYTHKNLAPEWIEDMEQDLREPVFRDHPLFANTESPIYDHIRRILIAYAWRNPLIGYNKLFIRILAFLLLHYDEEEAFWMLVQLVEGLPISSLPQNYFTPESKGAWLDQMVLEQLVLEKLPRLHSHFQQIGLELSEITLLWLQQLFIYPCVPVETCMRVWDLVFCYRGSLVLIETAFALLALCEEPLLQTNSVQEVASFFRDEAPRKCFDADLLHTISLTGSSSARNLLKKQQSLLDDGKLAKMRASHLEALEFKLLYMTPK